MRYGFKPDPEGVRLKCDPEVEASTFEQGARHGTWELLEGIETPVVVVAGRIEPVGPAMFAEAIARQLPHGRFVLDETLDHFGPFTDPARVAALIASEATSGSSVTAKSTENRRPDPSRRPVTPPS